MWMSRLRGSRVDQHITQPVQIQRQFFPKITKPPQVGFEPTTLCVIVLYVNFVHVWMGWSKESIFTETHIRDTLQCNNRTGLVFQGSRVRVNSTHLPILWYANNVHQTSHTVHYTASRMHTVLVISCIVWPLIVVYWMSDKQWYSLWYALNTIQWLLYVSRLS